MKYGGELGVSDGNAAHGSSALVMEVTKGLNGSSRKHRICCHKVECSSKDTSFDFEINAVLGTCHEVMFLHIRNAV
jgi:hypothetical protein